MRRYDGDATDRPATCIKLGQTAECGAPALHAVARKTLVASKSSRCTMAAGSPFVVAGVSVASVASVVSFCCLALHCLRSYWALVVVATTGRRWDTAAECSDGRQLRAPCPAAPPRPASLPSRLSRARCTRAPRATAIALVLCAFLLFRGRGGGGGGRHSHVWIVLSTRFWRRRRKSVYVMVVLTNIIAVLDRSQYDAASCRKMLQGRIFAVPIT